MSRRDSGFTLIELMIVAAIVSVVAGVAVPNLLSSRSVANERAVIAALRTISSAQILCQSQALVDLDGDGQGEALGLDEMAGLRPLRSTGQAMYPAALAPSLGTVDALGRSQGRGYVLALHLPDLTGTGLVASPANDASIDPDQAEVAWTCLAWPVTRGRTGTATYFLNQSGEILVAKDAPYDGVVAVPPPGAALVGVPATTIVGGTLAIDTLGADGNTWRPIR